MVSIWVFDKNELNDKKKKTPVSDKAMIEQLFQIMKKDFSALKEANFPTAILKIEEVVEEGKSALVFTTEPIICSLADIFNKFDNLPGGGSIPSISTFFENGFVVSELEVSRGLHNLLEGLQYIHTVMRKLHLNINPESVVITAEGVWKLCNFGLSLGFQQGDQLRVASPYFLKASSNPSNINPNLIRLEPDIRYSAIELTAGGYNPPGIRYLTPAADVFSLGVLAYEFYNYNLKCGLEYRPHSTLLAVTNSSSSIFHSETAINAISTQDFTFLPAGVNNILRGMLHPSAGARLSLLDIMNNAYFLSGNLAVLKNIDSLQSRDIGSQYSTLVGLTNQLGSFPTRMLESTVLTAICKLCISNAALWMYALPVHIVISQRISPLQYQAKAGQYIAQGLNVTNPSETIQCFLKNIDFLLNSFDIKFIQPHLINLFSNALDKQHVPLQSFCLKILCEEKILKILEVNDLSEKIVPKACKDACKNADPNIKCLALYFLSFVCSRLDRAYLAKNFLPSLKYISDNEKNPNVSMCVIGLYDNIADCLGPEYVATSILPTIQPMLIDRSLNKTQFLQVSNLVKMMLSRVLKMRSEELGLPPVNIGIDGSSQADYFSAAKFTIQQLKSKENEDSVSPSSSFAMSSLSTALPPPPPSTPAPSLPPTLTSSSTSSLLSNSSIPAPPSYSVPPPTSYNSSLPLSSSSTKTTTSDLDVNDFLSSFSNVSSKAPGQSQSSLSLSSSVIATSTPLTSVQTQGYSINTQQQQYQQPLSMYQSSNDQQQQQQQQQIYPNNNYTTYPNNNMQYQQQYGSYNNMSYQQSQGMNYGTSNQSIQQQTYRPPQLPNNNTMNNSTMNMNMNNNNNNNNKADPFDFLN